MKKDLYNAGAKLVEAVSERLDGWQNAITMLGTNRDKGSYSRFVKEIRLPDETAAAMFRGDDFTRKIVAKMPAQAFGMGIRIRNNTPDTDVEDVEDDRSDIMKEMFRLRAVEKAFRADVWGRLFGGGAILVGVRDGKTNLDPLEIENIRELLFLKVIDKRDLVAATYYQDSLSPKFGEIETYRLTLRTDGPTAAPSIEFHETRLIMFGGALTSDRDKAQSGGWDDSVIQSCENEIKQTNSLWQSVNTLVSDMSQGIFKVKGFMSLLASGNEAMWRTRFQITDMARSVARSLIVDADKEDFSYVDRNLSGLDSLTDRSWQRLASAAEMPLTVLMGVSPAGLNATGESDIRNWYDQCHKHQIEISPQMTILIQIVAKSIGIDTFEEWEIEWPKLWQMTPAEEADLQNKQADTDSKNITSGMVLPEEAALSRFGSGHFSLDTKIDTKVRKAALKDSLAEMKDPAPPALPPTGGNGAPPMLPEGSVDRTMNADNMDHETAEAHKHAVGYLEKRNIPGKKAESDRHLGALVIAADAHPHPLHLAAHLDTLTVKGQSNGIDSVVMDLHAKAEGKPTTWLGKPLSKKYQPK